MKLIDLGSNRNVENGTETKLLCQDGKSRWCYCTRKCYYYNQLEIKPNEIKLKINVKTKQISLW